MKKSIKSWTSGQRRLLEDLYTQTDGKTAGEIRDHLDSVLPGFGNADIIYQAKKQRRELADVQTFPMELCKRFIKILETGKGSREVELELENARLKAQIEKLSNRRAGAQAELELGVSPGSQVYGRCKDIARKLQWEGNDQKFFVKLIGRWSGCNHLVSQLSAEKAAEAMVRLDLVWDAITNQDIRSKSKLEAVFLGPIQKLEAVQ